MPETQRDKKIIEVSYVCDKCNLGMMESTNIVLTSSPPQFPHICSWCGHTQNFYKQYTRIEYV